MEGLKPRCGSGFRDDIPAHPVRGEILFRLGFSEEMHQSKMAVEPGGNRELETAIVSAPVRKHVLLYRQTLNERSSASVRVLLKLNRHKFGEVFLEKFPLLLVSHWFLERAFFLEKFLLLVIGLWFPGNGFLLDWRRMTGFGNPVQFFVGIIDVGNECHTVRSGKNPVDTVISCSLIQVAYTCYLHGCHVEQHDFSITPNPEKLIVITIG